jgi:hypothetical protein
MPKAIDKPTLPALTHGQRVAVNAKLQRIRIYPRRDWQAYRFRFAKTGIFLGWRALRNGTVDHDYEAGVTFSPTGPIVWAALVSLDTRRAPIYVPFADIHDAAVAFDLNLEGEDGDDAP